MTQTYASLLDQVGHVALPLTDRTARYLRDTVKNLEGEIAKLVGAETHFLQEAAGAKAVRELLEATRDNYLKGLGDHAIDARAQRWPIDTDIHLGHTETCSHCRQEMAWTEKHGYVHEVDGWWVAAGEFCQQPKSHDQQVSGDVDTGGHS
jgi:hypothetical protein